MAVKSFNIGEMESFVLEKEAKKRKMSQSALVNELIKNNLENMQQLQMLDRMDQILAEILELYKKLENRQELTLRLLAYQIDIDKIIEKAKENKDYMVLDFLLNTGG